MTQHPKKILIRYLNNYLSKKDLKMKNVLRNIKERIVKDQPITIRQYQSIIKFIEREDEFRGCNRQQIYQFFEPIIQINERKVVQYGNTLTEHFA
jgi:hypothetical protein